MSEKECVVVESRREDNLNELEAFSVGAFQVKIKGFLGIRIKSDFFKYKIKNCK